MNTLPTIPIPIPITRLQAIRERWALVRSKIAAVWPRVKAFFSPWQALALGLACVGLLALVVYLVFTPDRRIGKTTSEILLDHTARLQQLEARLAGLTASAQQQHQAPAEPWATTPWTAPAPAASKTTRPAAATPQPAASRPASGAGPMATRIWGTTDLDRAIADFDPSTANPTTTTNTTTTGAQP